MKGEFIYFGKKILILTKLKKFSTRTSVYFRVGAIQKINDIAKTLKGEGIDKVIVMSGHQILINQQGLGKLYEKALKDNEKSGM